MASGLGSARTLVHDDGVAIAAEVSGIKQWSAGISDRAPMAAGDRRYFGRIVGAMPSFAAIHGWTLGQGAMFEDRHVADRAAVAVIGTAAAAALFGGQPPVGRTFLIRNQTFTVAGVTDSTIEDHAASVFVPFTALQAMRGGTHLDSITIAAERRGKPRGLRSRQRPFSACATGSARATAGRRPACPTTSPSRQKPRKR